MEVTLSGMVTLVKPADANAYPPMEVTPFRLVTLLKPVQLQNPSSPLEATIPMMVTLARLGQD